MAVTQTKRDKAQDRFNELHVFCRLRDVGVPKWISRLLSSLWGKMSGVFLYKGNAQCK